VRRDAWARGAPPWRQRQFAIAINMSQTSLFHSSAVSGYLDTWRNWRRRAWLNAP